jgi:glycosyltransferase involved in cell wall biosynthesis
MPKVSVCIAHYQGIELIDACIASVRAQAGGIDVEIVVHDDASPDGSALHLREKHPDVKLIASAENAGFCVASNRMAAACGD